MSDLSERIGAFLNQQEETQRATDDALAANQAKIKPFLEETVLPAFRELKDAFEQHGRTVDVDASDTYARIEISKPQADYPGAKQLELRYTVEPRAYTSGFHVTVKTTRDGRMVGETILGGKSPIELDEISRETVVDDVFRDWRNR